MIFRVVYHESVLKVDIPKIAEAERLKIKKAIESKLETRPQDFGKPLRRSLNGYRSLRVGDYRVAYRIEKEIVKVFVIAHRSVVYEVSKNRN